MPENITLEMSLKPFKQTDSEYIKGVCEKVFTQWLPLIKNAKVVSILLWAADGSEILDYKGDMGEEFEWAKYIGGANTKETRNREADPEGLGLHARNYLYMKNPPAFTYGKLKEVVSALKAAGREILKDKKIRVGAIFDPGPEFAKSSFKYERHSEICMGDGMGKASMVCAYATLNADKTHYAGFPDGIPEGLPFGTFFGRQSEIFLTDMGFDYIWFSNGFGFGMEAWGVTGAIFDGETFHIEKLEEVRDKNLGFWKLFRAECPHFPIETRGTNFSLGIDYATDGVALAEIYEGGFNILPPPNSPWAAINGDFGLELAGHMSRIAKIPKDEYLVRFYLHDPWWVNSPWYDRYEGQPYDIYMPFSISRIDEKGAVKSPTHFNLLTIDNSFGDMPEACVYEPLPHMLKAFKNVPDMPSPLVWVYPFDEFVKTRKKEVLGEMLFYDWFMIGAMNNGLPVSTVISTDNFAKNSAKSLKLFKDSVLISPVPEAGGEYEREIISFVKGGGKVIFYGPVDRASEEFLSLINVSLADGISGELRLSAPLPDKVSGGGFPDTMMHRPLSCAGEVNTVLKSENQGAAPLMSVKAGDERVAATLGENFAWVRGTVSSGYVEKYRAFVRDGGDEYLIGEKLMRAALSKLGYEIEFISPNSAVKLPTLTVSRHDNAYMFSVFQRETVVETALKFPLGAPLLIGYEAQLKGGYAHYRFPRAEYKECRAFVLQDEGVISCREIPPVSHQMRRRVKISGLKNATVRFIPEKYCEGNLHVVLNSYPDHYFVGDEFDGEYVKGGYYEARNVSGDIVLSMPFKDMG